jgi:hypothetical protein
MGDGTVKNRTVNTAGVQIRKDSMRLRYKDDGAPVRVGDRVIDRDGDTITVLSASPPHKPSSSGRVFVQNNADGWKQEFFPHVFDMVWEYEDAEEAR